MFRYRPRRTAYRPAATMMRYVECGFDCTQWNVLVFFFLSFDSPTSRPLERSVQSAATVPITSDVALSFG
jgi:hypothetical protein